MLATAPCRQCLTGGRQCKLYDAPARGAPNEAAKIAERERERAALKGTVRSEGG